jgi:prepilin-type N-terminal cleavage/methylation domain-containing protein
MKKTRGFTLIEILVVIGIIAILAAVVIIAINPARQFAQARNSQRESNVNTILNAIGQNLADNRGIFTCGAVTLAANTASSTIVTAAGGTLPAGLPATTINLSCLTPNYIAALPSDPDSVWAATPYTGYDVSTDSTGRVLVCASRSITEAQISTPGPTVCVKR